MCWDNALAKLFFFALRNERVYRTVCTTEAQAKRDVVAHIGGGKRFASTSPGGFILILEKMGL